MRQAEPAPAAAAAVPSDLILSNLAIPPTPAYAVHRPRLAARLDSAAAHSLTILEAPAGCGKTTLLGGWALGRSAPTAWLTAEPDMGDFWQYLSAALLPGTAALPHTAETGPPGAQAGPPSGESLALLVNRLVHLPEPITLIVDDAHEIDDPATFDRLDYVLRHAGGNLRLVLGTRAEPPMPLHRWRVRDELTVLGAAELAFTAEETAQVVSRMGIVLPPADLADLQSRTEGWPAGVCLSALSVKDRTGRAAGTDRRLTGFLITEVLGGQPGEVRDALLDASVLDRVHSDLLDALTGRRDGRRMLSDLARRGVLLTPVGQSDWYRLHPLFREALRDEASHARPERIPALHVRAAAWLADRDLAAEALRHALATPDRELIAHILYRHWPDLLPYGHRQPPAADPPGPSGAARTDPVLALAYAAERLSRGDADGAEAYLRLAEPDPDTARIRDVLRLAHSRLRGDVRTMADVAGRILSEDEGRTSSDDAAAAAALTARGTAELLYGQPYTAEQTLHEGHTRAVAAGLPCLVALSVSRSAYAQALRGDLLSADEAARSALSMPLCTGQTEPVHGAHAYLAMAIGATLRDRLDEALSLVDRAEALFDPATDPALAPTIGLARAQILTECGRWADAHRELLSARRFGTRSSYLEHLMTAAEASLLTALGDPAAARTLVDAGEGPRPPILAVAYAEACLREHDHRTAVAAVQDVTDDGQLGLRAALIHSRAAWQRGDSPAAALERALALAEPQGLRRPFTGVAAPERQMMLRHLDSATAHRSFLSDLLEPGPSGARPDSAPGLLEPLTEREMTVLRYLQSVLSHGEVAGEMCLSVNTVKTHVRNIYRKLGAKHRRDAIRRARELQLL